LYKSLDTYKNGIYFTPDEIYQICITPGCELSRHYSSKIIFRMRLVKNLVERKRLKRFYFIKEHEKCHFKIPFSFPKPTLLIRHAAIYFLSKKSQNKHNFFKCLKNEKFFVILDSCRHSGIISRSCSNN